MMPENSVYGEWPASGEIDIMESKGNPSSYETSVLAMIYTDYLHLRNFPTNNTSIQV